MKAVVALLIIVCSFEAYVEAGIGIEYPDLNFKHNGHCYSRKLKLEMSKGEIKQIPGNCEIATCKDNKSVQYNICAPFQVLAPCTVSAEDPTKAWPRCCPQAQCPKN